MFIDKEKGFHSLLIILILGIVLVVFIGGFLANKLFIKTDPPNPIITTPLPTSSPTSPSIFEDDFKDYKNDLKVDITGIYELENTVIYTTNQLISSRIYTWHDPQYKTETYMGMGNSFNYREQSQAIIKKNMVYQIRIFNPDKKQQKIFDEYIFKGNRSILQDPRCPTFDPTNTQSFNCNF